jgi:hypothetical protein
MAIRPPLLPGRLGKCYDPWADLRENWPAVTVQLVPMAGDLLGEIRQGGSVIALRAGTTPGQRRSTLAHEIVHLERGADDCGWWQPREERRVHAEAARRLISLDALDEAVRLTLPGDRRSVASLLDVDLETLDTRLDNLRPAEVGLLRQLLADAVDLCAVA